MGTQYWGSNLVCLDCAHDTFLHLLVYDNFLLCHLHLGRLDPRQFWHASQLHGIDCHRHSWLREIAYFLGAGCFLAAAFFKATLA